MTLVDWPEDFDALPYRLKVSFEVNKLKLISVVGPMMRMNGKFSYLDETEDDVEFKTTVDIDSLAFFFTVEDESWSITFKDYIVSYAFNEATNEYSIVADGEVDDSDLGGSIRIETHEPFKGSGDSYPTSGVMNVIGANDSSVLGTAMDDGVQLKLEVDEDGDGTPDYTEHVNWENLLEDL